MLLRGRDLHIYNKEIVSIPYQQVNKCYLSARKADHANIVSFNPLSAGQ